VAGVETANTSNYLYIKGDAANPVVNDERISTTSIYVIFERYSGSAWVEIWRVGGSMYVPRFMEIIKDVNAEILVNDAANDQIRNLIKTATFSNGTVVGDIFGDSFVLAEDKFYKVKPLTALSWNVLQPVDTSDSTGTEFSLLATTPAVDGVISTSLKFKGTIPVGTVMQGKIFKQSDLINPVWQNVTDFQFSQGVGTAVDSVTGISETKPNVYLIGNTPLKYVYNFSQSVTLNGSTTDGTSIYLEAQSSRLKFENIQVDNVDSLTADATHIDNADYLVHTIASAININVPFDENSTFTVRDADANFATNSCNVLFKDAGGSLQYTVTLDNSNESFFFFNDGTNWNYSRDGEGKTYTINTNRTASVDFPDSVSGFWDRTGTTLSPKTTGDNITTSGNVHVGGDVIVDGSITSGSTENLLVKDNHIVLNDGYQATTAKMGGLVVNYLPTSTADTVAAGAFVAGVAAASNPTVATVGASVFTDTDLIMIYGSVDNDGIYEVASHTANVLTVKGVGTISTVEGFTNTQFNANASDSCTITKINVSVICSDTDGEWRQGKGSTTPVTFTDLSYDYWERTGTTLSPKIAGDNISTTGTVITPKIIGGSSTTQDLTFQTTTGVGTTGSDMNFLIGTNGDTRAMNISHIGHVSIGYSSSTTSNYILGIKQPGGHTYMDIDSFNASYDTGIRFKLQGTDTWVMYNDNNTGNFNIWEGGSSRMTFVSGGNVGIGISDPDAPLEITTTSTTTEAPLLKLTSQNDRALIISQPDITSNNSPFTFDTNNAVSFRIDATDVLTIDAYKNVGIGVTEIAPATEKLDVVGTVKATGGNIISTTTTGKALSVEANTLTTGAGLYVGSSSTNLSDKLVELNVSDASATGDVLSIDNNGIGQAIDITSNSTTNDVIKVVSDNLVSGSMISLNSASSSDINRDLLEIKHTGTGNSTSAIDINLGASRGSILNGYSSNTTLPALRLDSDSLTYGAVAHFASSSADTNIRKLVHIQNSNAASTGTTGVVIDQASTGDALSTNGNISAGSYDGVLNDGVTATTQTVGDNSTKVATTEYADAKPTIYSANGELASTRAIIGENGKTLTFEMFNPTENNYTTKTAIIQANDQIDLLQVTGNGAGDEGAYLGIRLGQGSTNKLEFIDEKYSKGAVYNADYSTNFTDRSIVDKAYVDNSITGLNPSGTHDILIAADLEALATSSIITVTTGTTLTLNIKGAISSDTRYVVESGGRLNLNYALSGSYTYTETGTQDQFTSTNGSIFLRNGSMTASGTLSTLFNNTYNSPFQVLNIVGTIFNGYHGGSLSGWGALTFDGSPIIDYRDSITVSGQAGIKCINVSGYSFSVFPNKPAFDIKRGYGGTSVNIFSLGSWSLYGGSFIRLSPGMGDNSKNLISGLVMNLGDLFDTTGTDGTFTAVADASFSTVTIDNVSNVGGNARFNCTIVPSFSVGQEVTISGFLTYTAYNKTSIVTATDGSTYFDIDSTPYIGSENGTGSFGSSTVTLTDTATTLSNGDSITLDSMDQNYRGGTHVYNKQTNSFQVNKTWNATATGTWSTKGLDQEDIRVIASGNPTIVDSHYYACGYVNGNTSTTTISASGTYYDIDFGTLTECPQTERWKIIDAKYGIFEYIGNEPFHGTVKYDYSAVSSGSAQNFLFKWQKDTGSGYADIAGAIALNQLAGTAGSTGRSVSIQAVKGDLFKCKVTRASGSGNITVSYAGIIID
ncbi:MAG: hypothetical protein GY804_03635, partial [Alphaproteobacteria bacterium]|nr:hypothetical protein [Alphaproteobacteria bacterium]